MLSNLKYENLSKPSNKKWKLIADIGLYMLPLFQGAIVTMPVSDNLQKWLRFGTSILIIGFKAVSKFTTDETNQ